MADFKEVFRDAIAAAQGKLQAQAPEAQEFVREVAAAHRKSLASLLAAFADGKIDEPTLESELEDEKLVFQGELLAVQAIAKKAAQDAANAFFDVLDKALVAGIGGLL